MKFKYQPIWFKTRTNRGLRELHYGYAVDWDLPVRVVVHQDEDENWTCTHYDSGMSVTPYNEFQKSRNAAVVAAHSRLANALKSGVYANAINILNRGAKL